MYRERTRVDFEFGSIMAYIEERALPDDLIMMNQPALWPFVEYYGRRNLDVAYVPDSPRWLTAEAVDEEMRSLLAQRSRVWLGPIGAWTEDPESLVEQWLATHSFPARKEWFPGSGSATLYFMTNSLEPLAAEPGIEWAGKIRLLTAQSSVPTVAPGDGLRLSFSWEAVEPMDVAYLVSVFLVDEAGLIWAERQSEPCSGWCPTETWEQGVIVHDHHALLIPPGTPPGLYRLQVGWYAPAEEEELAAAGFGQRLDLGMVEVVRDGVLGRSEAPSRATQNPLEARFGDRIALLGFDLADPETPAGETALLDLDWLALGPLSDDYGMQVALQDADGQTVASWTRPLAAESHPSSSWQAGEYVRGRHRLDLPRETAPGSYRLHLTLLGPDERPLAVSGTRPQQELGGLIRWQAALDGESLELTTLQVTEWPDRPRNFDLPAMDHSLPVRVGQKSELLGYDLVADSAEPGGRIDLTLYWRGGGPTVQPYKVFAHLSDNHLPLAQHDGPPGQGCCPTDTWAEGEVVVDQHTILLPADLAPGTYRLTAGMYDEQRDARLSVFDVRGNRMEGDAVRIDEIVVRPGSTPAPTVRLPDTAHRVYLPIIRHDSLQVPEAGP
jgi:hypothetical protein